MILITGGAGFIGSALIWHLNQAGIRDIVVVDRLGLGDKWRNLAKRDFLYHINKKDIRTWLDKQQSKLTAIIHLGACSATTERDADYLMDNNVGDSRLLWDVATSEQIPFIYASSAATYGSEESNFEDSHERIGQLLPINKYGFSKQIFDRWVLSRERTPPRWFGLKFFNVYGPQEYHKGAQSSVVFHAFNQIKKLGSVKLFKSYRPQIAHGEQLRDFVYVKDVVKVIHHFLNDDSGAQSGIYNLGTGQARSFTDLAKSVFYALDLKSNIEWIEMPESLRNQYQYFTQASLDKLRSQGNYNAEFTSLEQGVEDYVSHYLNAQDRYL